MKKQKEDEILKKKDKACKFTAGNKFVAALMVIGIVLGGIFGLVACNNSNENSQTGPGTEIMQPGDEDKDDDEQGGEITNPDEGEEEKPNPDNPGGDTGTGDEDEDGKDDEGETTNPDEGEDEKPNPDQGDEEELEPPQSVEDLLINPDYQNSEYMIKVEDALNTYLKEKIVSSVSSSLDIKNIDDIEWRIDGSASDTSINKITISFTNYASDTSKGIYVQSVTPKGGLTLEDLYNPDETKLNDAFKLAIIGGAKYNYEFSFNYDPSIQEASKPLIEALKNVAIQKGDLEIEIDENTEFILVDEGYKVDTELGSEARQIVLYINSNSVHQELTYRIPYPDYNIDKLTEMVNAGKGEMVGSETKAIPGHQITVIEEEDEAASTASENIEVKYYKITTTDKTGATKIKYGSTVKLFDSMGRVAHTQGFSAANKKQIKKIVEKYTDDFANKEVFGEIGGYVITLDKER